MGLQIYLDGKLVPEEEATVSVFDHGLLYGDGIFEGIRAYNGRVFRLDEHIARLYEGARVLKLDIPLSRDEMVEAILMTLRANDLEDAYIRLLVTRGVGDLGLDPRKCPNPTVVIIADSIALYPPEYYEKGLSVITCSTRRNDPVALDPAIKSLNYLNNILAKMEVNEAGVPEGIMLSTDGYVAECTGDNLFYVKDGGLITPPAFIGNLSGITKDVVIELAQEQNLPVHERLFRTRDVYTADECFLTGTAAELIPVVEVDGRVIGDGRPGPIFRELLDKYSHLTQTKGTPIYP
ncbi:MAG: branched-chain-amino-acid transaminase [Armatimonadota bacterium]